MIRVAVLDLDKCQPTKCGTPCVTYCPPVRNRIDAIKIAENGYPVIDEVLCIGCGICVAKCPFDVISVVKLPTELESDLIHQYGVNSFRLYRLPYMEAGKVTGIIGRNGIGKSTAMKLIAGQLTPNLGRMGEVVSYEEVGRHFRGTLLQDYFTRLASGELRVGYKPQQVDVIPKVAKGRVREVLMRLADESRVAQISQDLQLTHLLDREVSALSGGELQKLAIAATILRGRSVYIFDEPSSYLDIKQRMVVASVIRGLSAGDNRVLVCDHDLAVLDYVSDIIFLFYGETSVYGIVSGPYGVREGINTYLEGYTPLENVRFRNYKITFQARSPQLEEVRAGEPIYWNAMRKSYDGFRLSVSEGCVYPGNVIGIVGQNGIGKSTFIKLLAGIEAPDDGERLEYREISYKPQHPEAVDATVEEVLRRAAGDKFEGESYRSELFDPLRLNKIIDRRLTELSGGELQKVAIAEALSRDAAIYLLDEPSAYLDVEERYVVAKLMKRMAIDHKSCIFLVEHDIAVLDFAATQIMVFLGRPGIEGFAQPPTDLRTGFNALLRELGVTFRRDPATNRPRINKPGSRLDREQKALGEYYYLSS
ncbi:MAG: ribosome biogenesis/translation initiation ATPase RLI [Aigarchaeota archaeon]|nr:ribosome biogenesis/translation initiation ATPase RLI [Aigarchaeota archaeon]MDW8092336.1 ribosome biogenesis/translation initiation ATPase RLI [Nitrososphaerota archaeon]